MPNLKQLLAEGRVLVGTWVNSPSPTQVEIIGYAGFEFVVLDTEHSSYDLEDGENLIRAADAAGLPCLMRVSENQPASIGKVLDYGAQGVVVPHISTVDEAKHAVRGAHYAPLGERGAAPAIRAARYGSVPWPEYLKRAQADTLTVLQIEGQEGIANLNAIMAVEGLDVIFIGAFDLSESLGVSGQMEHPRLLETAGDIVQRARTRGLHVGIWMPSPELLGAWVEQGVQVLTVSNSDMIFLDGCRAVVEKVRKQMSPTDQA